MSIGACVRGDAIASPWGDVGSLATDDPLGLVARAYREHGGVVLRVATRVCGAALAEDVTQEVFVQLWRYPQRFDPARGSLRSFLVTVARGKAVDVLRSESSRRHREERRHRGYAGAVPPETAIDMRDAVNRLPERERIALVVAFYADRTYRQTALTLGQSEGTTKTRIRSGLQRLASSLDDSSVAVQREREPVE